MLKIKDLDKKIILELLRDAKQPAFVIADKVGATRQTVAKKIDQFYKSGLISSFAPTLEPEKFGLNIQAYVFMREEPGSDVRKENEEMIKDFPQVSEFHRIFGEYDSIIRIFVRDKNELTGVINKIHKLRGIRGTETFIVHSTIKNNPEDPFMKVLLAP